MRLMCPCLLILSDARRCVILAIKAVDVINFEELLDLQAIKQLSGANEEVLKLLNLLVRHLLLVGLPVALLALLIQFSLQAAYLVPEFSVLDMLPVKLALNDVLSIALERLLLMDSLGLELLLAQFALQVGDVFPC